MGRQDNRDRVIKLGGAKNVSRADADSPLSLFDSIFLEIKMQFNDPELTLPEPERASFYQPILILIRMILKELR